MAEASRVFGEEAGSYSNQFIHSKHFWKPRIERYRSSSLLIRRIRYLDDVQVGEMSGDLIGLCRIDSDANPRRVRYFLTASILDVILFQYESLKLLLSSYLVRSLPLSPFDYKGHLSRQARIAATSTHVSSNHYSLSWFIHCMACTDRQPERQKRVRSSTWAIYLAIAR